MLCWAVWAGQGSLAAQPGWVAWAGLSSLGWARQAGSAEKPDGAQNSTGFHGILQDSMEFRNIPWHSAGFHGIPCRILWNSATFRGILQGSMAFWTGFYGIPQHSAGFYGILARIPQHSAGYCGIPRHSAGFRGIPQDSGSMFPTNTMGFRVTMMDHMCLCCHGLSLSDPTLTSSSKSKF